MSEGRSPDADRSRAELHAELGRVRRQLQAAESAGVDHAERRRTLEDRLFRQNEALVELALSHELARGEFEGFSRLAASTAARTLDVARVSIWLFNEDRSHLRCSELYEQNQDRHSSGMELLAESHPRYFAALNRGRRVAAHDAHQDPDTSEFSESYLTPLGINSMLDAPLRSSGKLIGVVCHEHVGPPRVWAPEEQTFASSVADFCSLVLEARERIRAERAFRSSQEELLRRQWQATKQVEGQLEETRCELIRKTRLATIGEVAASIAHELRNPLGAMRNAVYFLKRRRPLDETKWNEYLGIIDDEINAADGILSNLLEMSRAKSPLAESVDLEQAVRVALAHARATDSLELRLDLEPTPFILHADPTQLRQVLTNLVLNAAQATDEPGRLTVLARRQDGEACITVHDDGPGVPRDQRDRVFEPLFSLRAKGTGLGLPICRQILAGHGGTIELLDLNEPGAAFLIRIPGRAESNRAAEG